MRSLCSHVGRQTFFRALSSPAYIYCTPCIRSIASAMASSNPVTKFDSHPAEHRTFARQGELPKLPIPPLGETCKRYLASLEGLQDKAEHEATKRAVEEFLQNDGPRMQERLIEYAKDKARCARYLPLDTHIFTHIFSYIEEFWYIVSRD